MRSDIENYHFTPEKGMKSVLVEQLFTYKKQLLAEVENHVPDKEYQRAVDFIITTRFKLIIYFLQQLPTECFATQPPCDEFLNQVKEAIWIDESYSGRLYFSNGALEQIYTDLELMSLSYKLYNSMFEIHARRLDLVRDGKFRCEEPMDRVKEDLKNEIERIKDNFSGAFYAAKVSSEEILKIIDNAFCEIDQAVSQLDDWAVALQNERDGIVIILEQVIHFDPYGKTLKDQVRQSSKSKAAALRLIQNLVATENRRTERTELPYKLLPASMFSYN